MLSKLIFSGLSVVSLSLTALGASMAPLLASDSINLSDSNSVASAIQGTWVLGCQSFSRSTSWPPDDTQSAIYTYTFVGSDFTWLAQNFSDKNCKKPLFSRSFKGTFKVGDVIPGLENVYALDMLNITETYKLLDPSARVFDFCRGGDNVLAGESECSFMDLYQIIRPESNGLQFGRYINDSDGESPDNRPKFLNNSVFKRS